MSLKLSCGHSVGIIRVYFQLQKATQVPTGGVWDGKLHRRAVPCRFVGQGKIVVVVTETEVVVVVIMTEAEIVVVDAVAAKYCVNFMICNT